MTNSPRLRLAWRGQSCCTLKDSPSYVGQRRLPVSFAERRSTQSSIPNCLLTAGEGFIDTEMKKWRNLTREHGTPTHNGSLFSCTTMTLPAAQIFWCIDQTPVRGFIDIGCAVKRGHITSPTTAPFNRSSTPGSSYRTMSSSQGTIIIKPPFIKHGPHSHCNSVVALQLSLTHDNASLTPQVVLRHLFGQDCTESERSKDLKASWADIVEQPYLRDYTEEAITQEYLQLSDVQKDVLWNPEYQVLRNHFQAQTLNSIASRLILDLLDGASGSSVPDLDILLYESPHALSDIASCGKTSVTDYSAWPCRTVDERTVNAERERQDSASVTEMLDGLRV